MEKRRLAALDRFTCLADRCSDNCCGLWEVEVEEETLQRWQGLPRELREELESHLAKDRKEGETGTFFRKTPEGKCCHLDARGLCRLQLTRGVEVLPRICREFPRFSMKNEIRELASATLSCPEIARLVLEGEGPLFIVERGEALEGEGRSESARRFARFLDDWVRRTMGISSAPLEQRIFYLASVIGQLYARHHGGERVDELLPILCEDPGAHLDRISAAAGRMDLRSGAAAAGAFWRRAYHLSRGAELTVGGRPLGSTLLGRELTAVSGGDRDLERLHGRYLECRAAVREKMKAIAPLLERLVRLSLMSSGFPWHPVEQNHVTRLIESLTPFTMVMLAAYALGADRGKPVDSEDLCEIVCKVESNLTHSAIVQQDLSANLHILQLHHYAPVFLLL